MEVVLLKKAKRDHDYWKQTRNVKIMKRITELLKDIYRGDRPHDTQYILS